MNDDIRVKLLEIAYSELGTTDPSRYWQKVFGSVPKGKAWCGIFALWCMHETDLCDWTWSIVAPHYGFLWRLPRVVVPKPGDVAYFDKPYQHHALVQSLDGDRLALIQGNYGVPGRVAESVHMASQKHPAYFSIEGLVQACAAHIAG